jgi:aryl-phospho-beta-D-glucosidase BglC (GH1 family)
MTLFKQVADNAVSTTTTSMTSTGVTSITAASGNGALFPLPGNGFILTIWNGSDPTLDANMEKVVVSARSGDVLTIAATTKTHTSPTNIGLLDVAQNTIDLQKSVNALESKTSNAQRGVAISGLEFTPSVLPGTAGTDFPVPVEADYSYFAAKGMQLIRLPFLWERIQPTVSSALDATYKGYIDNSIGYARKYNLRVILDVHNAGGRSVSGVAHKIGDGTLTVAHFADLWSRLATAYKDEPTVVMYDLMNEPNGMPIPTNAANYLVQSGPSQLIANPSFELGATNWYTDGDYTVGQTLPYLGLNEMTQSSSSGYGTFGSGSPIPVTPGTDYTLSMWYKMTSTTQFTAPHLRINHTDLFNGAISDTQPFVPTTTWTRISVTFNSGTYSQVWMQVQNNGNAVTAYYDAINLTPGTSAGNYLDSWNTGQVSSVTQMEQAAINAIRLVDANTWISLNTDNFAGISDFVNTYGGSYAQPWWTDPSNKVMVSFHYYQDTDRSGTYVTAWSSTLRTRIPSDILTALKWGNANGIPLYMGEYGVPNGTTSDALNWQADLETLLQYMDEYGVYGSHWAGGSGYTAATTIEPTSNYTVDVEQMPIIQRHLSFSSLRLPVSSTFGPASRLIASTRSTQYPYAILPTDSMILADASVATFSLTLPNPVNAVIGRIYTVSKVDTSANEVAVNPFGSETINGAPYQALCYPGTVLGFITDGINWRIA